VETPYPEPGPKAPTPDADQVKAEAGDEGFAHLPTGADQARYADAAAQILGEFGRHQRGDISRRKWQQLRDDVRQFVEAGWAHLAYHLGWHPLELLGVDRTAPWARRDRRGLMLSLDGSRVVALTERAATMETESGARLTYRRMPVEMFHIVPIYQIATAYRTVVIKREWAEVLTRLDRCRLPQEVSYTRWQQYRGVLHGLAEGYWDFMPADFMDWDARGAFPSRATRALAWVMGEQILTYLTPDTAVCGKVVFRRLPGDGGWQMLLWPFPDPAHEKLAKLLGVPIELVASS
jgi:hypothetical protein